MRLTEIAEGGSQMKIKVEIIKDLPEPEIVIKTAAMTVEIENALERLSASYQKLIAGFDGDSVYLLDADRVVCFYSSGQKVMARSDRGEFSLRLRLYELEERLDSSRFVRISNSEIINLGKVEKIDLSFTGTICIHMSDGSLSYASRRYVSRVKKALGI